MTGNGRCIDFAVEVNGITVAHEAGVGVEAVGGEDGERGVLARECGRARHDVRDADRSLSRAAACAGLRVEHGELVVVRVREELRANGARVALHDALVVARPLLQAVRE